MMNGRVPFEIGSVEVSELSQADTPETRFEENIPASPQEAVTEERLLPGSVGASNKWIRIPTGQCIESKQCSTLNAWFWLTNDFLENIWRKENSPWKRTTDQTAKSSLRRSLQTVLDDSSLPDDIKAKLHQQSLNRFLHTTRQLPVVQHDLISLEPKVDDLLKLDLPEVKPAEVKKPAEVRKVKKKMSSLETQ